MKQFKLIDFYTSIGLIVGCIITGILIDHTAFIAAYFIVGGWQVISMLVHAYYGWFTGRQGNRFYYHCFAAVCVACMLLGIVAEPFLFIFVILLFLAPLMALYYIRLCYTELFFYMVRPLDLLK